MKKMIFTGLALGLMTMVSCQKELTENTIGTAVPQITKTVYVEGNRWLPDTGTRTAYTPGTGVDWIGNETFAIYYGDPDKAATATSENKYMQKAEDVTALGGGKYSFRHEDLGIGAYNYSVIVPDIVTTGLQGSGMSATFKLSPVQTPGANTYDPNYDILFGQGAFGVAPAEELEITRFKRVTAPLRLSLTDGAGVIGDEKIYAATVSFSQDAVSRNGFAGTLFLNFGYEYEDCKVNSITAPSATVTAVYADGLAKSGDSYPVWYSVHPAVFAAGGELTVTVTTETKTISRTVAMASEASIQADILNDLSFDISGEGYTEAESLYWDFTTLESLSSQLTASDGNQYGWGLTGCRVWNGNDPSGKLPSSLRADAGKGQISLPSVAGKQVSRIRLYAHPNNTTSKNTVSLNGAAGLDFNSYAVNNVTRNSGILEITVPEDQYGQPLVLTAGDNFSAFDGIALEFIEGAELPEADENDYYDLFTKGYDIEINGEVYNNSGYAARLVTAAELQKSDLQADAIKSGILFIDATDQVAPFEVSSLMTGADTKRVIWIGRYKDRQPQIKLIDQYKLRGPETIFKNIHLIAGHNTSMVNADAGGLLLSIDDCTLDLTGSKIVVQDIEGATINNLMIDNSIIEFGATSNSAVFAYNSKKATYQEIGFTLTNTVVYAESPVQAFIVNMGDGKDGNDQFDGYNANLNVSGNTFYNIWQPNILVRGQVFRNFTVDMNVASYNTSEVVAKPSNLACVYKSAETSSISGNYLFTDAEAGKQWNIVHSNSIVKAGEGNSRNPETNPYQSENIETGYFPINTSVVTNGAGADYDTKYWIRK